MSAQTTIVHSEKLRVCILGSGKWARVHAKVIRQCKNLELVGFYSRAEKFLAVDGKDFLCYSSIIGMIRESRPHICVVANATKFHYEDAICVLKGGVSVLIEKPVDVSFEKIVDLVRLANAKELFVGVSLPQRYDDKFRKLNSLLKSNYFGSIDFVDIKTFYHRSEESMNHTLLQAGANNQFALLRHYGVHYYDATCNALELYDVRLNANLVRDSHEGTVKSGMLLLTPKDSSTVVSLTFSTTSSPERRNSLEVIGSKDSVYLNRHGLFSHNNLEIYTPRESSFEDYLRFLWLDLYDLALNGNLSSSRIALNGLLASRHLFASNKIKESPVMSDVSFI